MHPTHLDTDNPVRASFTDLSSHTSVVLLALPLRMCRTQDASGKCCAQPTNADSTECRAVQ